MLVLVSGWLLTDPATSRVDALRTGGLAAGSVVALYALWLNDRRRKIEETRQRTERERYDLELLRTRRDSDRVTDERFAKSVELLGHEADQVRVGALHALAGLARNRTDYTQTVLDVLCSYLRRPFPGPDTDPDQPPDPAVERERQVRLTAQRLIPELLPPADSEGPSYDLDLTGAILEYFDPSGRKITSLTARRAQFCHSTNFSNCLFTGPAWFTQASTGETGGRFHCCDAVFAERAWFSGTQFTGFTEFTGTCFRGEVSAKNLVCAGEFTMRNAVFHESLDLSRARFRSHVDLRFARDPQSVVLYNTLVEASSETQLPEGWTAETFDPRRRRITVTPFPDQPAIR